MAKTLTPLIRTLDIRTAQPAPKKADPELLTNEHREWRNQVCERAGWQCEWVEQGQRCTRSRADGHRMIADHITERKDGGAALDPKNGQCLCVPHNTLKGIRARDARMQQRV
jgi:5-methylcytosine-specific restriction enzyme A